MQLFYNQDINTSSMQISFNKEESRHIVRVLRKTNGDILNITDGKGKLFSAEIIQAHDKKCMAMIKKWTEKPKTWNLSEIRISRILFNFCLFICE